MFDLTTAKEDPDKALNGAARVIVVVKNFNFVSIKEIVGTLVLKVSDKKNKLFLTKFIVIPLPKNDVKASISFIEKKWKEFSNEYPFEYFFLDDNLNNLYGSQDNLARLVAYFSVLAILITCLALFALALFKAHQRNKEIGIRKVLGAPVCSLISLMSKEFLKMVLISTIIALAVSFYSIINLLNNFAYGIGMGSGVLILHGFTGLFMALVTVLFHAFRSAYSNPVNALKYE